MSGLIDAEGWTVTVMGTGYETTPVPISPDRYVTMPVNPLDHEVYVDTYVLRFRGCEWRRGLSNPEKFTPGPRRKRTLGQRLRGVEPARYAGHTYTLMVPRDAFRLALGDWADSGELFRAQPLRSS